MDTFDSETEDNNNNNEVLSQKGTSNSNNSNNSTTNSIQICLGRQHKMTYDIILEDSKLSLLRLVW